MIFDSWTYFSEFELAFYGFFGTCSFLLINSSLVNTFKELLFFETNINTTEMRRMLFYYIFGIFAFVFLILNVFLRLRDTLSRGLLTLRPQSPDAGRGADAGR